MDSLFDGADFLGFGPARVAPKGEAIPLGHVTGSDLTSLRAGVREACPKTPGVYGMLDENGRLLYIGKSKALRLRLLSYFRPAEGDGKVRQMMAQTAAIVWEQLPHDFAALLRELQLIRRFRPKYNVQGQPGRLRRNFLCIGRAPAAYVYVAAQPTARTSDCFGPLLGGWRAREAARHLNDLFQLRDCAQSQAMRFSDQKALFPLAESPGCLRHELGTCLGTCIGATSRTTYARRLRRVRAFLSGQDTQLLTELTSAMQAAAAERRFEAAAKLRDQLAILGGLRNNLDTVAQARQRYAFVYPLADTDGTTLWYIIRGGQVECTLREPTTHREAQRTARVIRRVYERPAVHDDPLLLEAFDMVLLVARWFRQHPDQLAGVLQPETALAHCTALAPAAGSAIIATAG